MNKNIEKAIKSGKTLFLIYGEEKFLINSYMDIIKNHYLEPIEQDMNLEIIDAVPKDPVDVINKCSTLPFMAEYRVVILKDIGIFETKNKSFLDKLTEELKLLPKSTILVISEKTIDKRKKIYKYIEKNGITVECGFLSEKEINNYLGKWFYKFGLRIKSSAIQLLIQRVGSDLTSLLNESTKLSNYATEVVTDEMVMELVREQLESKIFALTDALGTRNRKEAVLQYRVMLENKESVNSILYMIGRHMKLLYQVQDLVKNRFSSYDIAKRLGLHSFVAEKLINQSKLFTQQEISDMLKELLNLEWDFKRGKVDLEIGLEMFLVKAAKSSK